MNIVRKQNLLDLAFEVRKFTNEPPVIVGSQAVFAVTDFPPEIARRSVECDFLLLKRMAENRAKITENLGLFSEYQQQTGFYADVLGLATVVLPSGWEERLVELKNEAGEITAFCAEIHDVCVSKLMAGREKDFEFLQTAFEAEYLQIETFLERARTVLQSSSSAALHPRLQKLIGKIDDGNLREIVGRLRDFEDEIKSEN